MKPGRKSTYDLLAPMIPGQSPPPPEELEADQQLEWEAITARLPADWFSGENIPMLKELCRHITYARELAKEIAEVKAMLSEVVAGTAVEAEKSNVMAAGRKELCQRQLGQKDLLAIIALCRDSNPSGRARQFAAICQPPGNLRKRETAWWAREKWHNVMPE
jgi:hypothetical protein